MSWFFFKKGPHKAFVYFKMHKHSLNQILDVGLVFSVLKANILTSH